MQRAQHCTWYYYKLMIHGTEKQEYQTKKCIQNTRHLHACPDGACQMDEASAHRNQNCVNVYSKGHLGCRPNTCASPLGTIHPKRSTPQGASPLWVASPRSPKAGRVAPPNCPGCLPRGASRELKIHHMLLPGSTSPQARHSPCRHPQRSPRPPKLPAHAQSRRLGGQFLAP